MVLPWTCLGHFARSTRAVFVSASQHFSDLFFKSGIAIDLTSDGFGLDSYAAHSILEGRGYLPFSVRYEFSKAVTMSSNGAARAPAGYRHNYFIPFHLRPAVTAVIPPCDTGGWPAAKARGLAFCLAF